MCSSQVFTSDRVYLIFDPSPLRKTSKCYKLLKKFFRQKSGLPMGSILSPLLSDLYMDEYVKHKLNKVNNKMCRYVDDLFIVTKMDENQIKTYVEDLNSIKNETIKVTYEFEIKKQLNYLDTTVTRNLDKKCIDIKWCRKATASDRLLHYESGHHRNIKLNIIKNMVSRIISTTTNINQQQQDLDTLRQMLLKSKYPKCLIESTILSCLKQQKTNTITPRTTSNQYNESKNSQMEYYLSLPYTPGMEVLKRRLEKFKIKLYFSYPKKLYSLVTTNNKPQPKSVIYQIDCECGATYNGETKVGLKTRTKQHEKIIEKDEENSNSEMIQHHHQKRWQCMFNPTLAYIIDKDTNYRKRRIKEAVYSIINNSINKHDTIDNSWNNILFKESTRIKETIKFKKKWQSNNKSIPPT